jgi:ribonuclease P protein component
MTPPEAKGQGRNAQPELAPAVSLCLPAKAPELQTLRHRADFLRAASARRQGTQGFLLQARARDDDTSAIRVGFTCSKKIGNAVTRNRAKRRLREIARALLPQNGRAGWDYVLVGRPGTTIDRDFTLLLSDMNSALERIHSQSGGARR